MRGGALGLKCRRSILCLEAGSQVHYTRRYRMGSLSKVEVLGTNRDDRSSKNNGSRIHRV